MPAKTLKAECHICGFSVAISDPSQIHVTSRGQPYIICKDKTRKGKAAVFLKRSDVKKFLESKRSKREVAAKIMKAMSEHEAKKK